VCDCLFVCLCPRPSCVGVSLRHGRCFWFSGRAGGDHGEAGVSEGGAAGVRGLGAVRRRDAAVLPHAARDGQTGLVPHGFGKRQLEEEEEGGGVATRKKRERRFSLGEKTIVLSAGLCWETLTSNHEPASARRKVSLANRDVHPRKHNNPHPTTPEQLFYNFSITLITFLRIFDNFSATFL